MSSHAPHWQVGVARRVINPPPDVELAGLGYYLNRTWQTVRDNLHATALIITDAAGNSLALVALDLMYNDVAFTARIREKAAAATGLRPESICVNCSHSHNAPTAGLILGGGEQHPAYLAFAADEAASAIAAAWQQRQPARLSVSAAELAGLTFNRAQPGGPTDNRVSILRADTIGGRPLALAVNFHSHCTAHMESEPRALSRDWPGEVVDQLEAALPGATALYLQGNVGDTNFRREFNGTARRFEPARAVTQTVLAALENPRPIEAPGLATVSHRVNLPTRRWRREEILRDREEGLHRQATGDQTNWLTGVARVCVGQPERLPLRYGGSVEKAVAAMARFAVEWTDRILPDLDTRPEHLEIEVQALRLGDVFFSAHPSELFTQFGLDLRRRWAQLAAKTTAANSTPKVADDSPSPGGEGRGEGGRSPAIPHANEDDLFILGFSNGSIGYVPDPAEIARGGYAALQSPKFTGQFPFTNESGPALIAGLLAALFDVAKEK